MLLLLTGQIYQNVVLQFFFHQNCWPNHFNLKLFLVNYYIFLVQILGKSIAARLLAAFD